MMISDPLSVACFSVKENSATNTKIGFPLRVDDQDSQHVGLTSAGRGSGHLVGWKIIGGRDNIFVNQLRLPPAALNQCRHCCIENDHGQ